MGHHAHARQQALHFLQLERSLLLFLTTFRPSCLCQCTGRLQAIVSVPMHNSLCLTDEPMSGISV